MFARVTITFLELNCILNIDANLNTMYRAAVTAAIAPGIAYLGVQYMFLLLGMILLLSNVVLWVIKSKGPAWRKRRAETSNI